MTLILRFELNKLGKIIIKKKLNMKKVPAKIIKYDKKIPVKLRKYYK